VLAFFVNVVNHDVVARHVQQFLFFDDVKVVSKLAVNAKNESWCKGHALHAQLS